MRAPPDRTRDSTNTAYHKRQPHKKTTRKRNQHPSNNPILTSTCFLFIAVPSYITTMCTMWGQTYACGHSEFGNDHCDWRRGKWWRRGSTCPHTQPFQQLPDDETNKCSNPSCRWRRGWEWTCCVCGKKRNAWAFCPRCYNETCSICVVTRAGGS